jgi:hypothetical protein
MRNLNDDLSLLYKESLCREESALLKIKSKAAVPLTYFSLLGENERKAWYYLFVKEDLVKAKQCFYLYGKVTEYLCKTTDVSMILGMTQDNTYTLLSDSKSLINTLPEWRYAGYDFDIKKGSLKYIIQNVVVGNDSKALELLDLFHNKHRKMIFKDENEAIIRAIIRGDKLKIEELLHFLLLPRNHKKTNGIYPLRRDLLSFPALGYAKLAWLRGIEIEIDHPLIPKDLLPIQPNKEYTNSYDFLTI